MDSRLMWGTLDLMILELIAQEATYGYRIAQSLIRNSKQYFDLKEGSLYPALHRMERQKLIAAYWVDSDERRKRKYYKITAKGRKALEEKRDAWAQFHVAVNQVLKGAQG